MRSMLAFTLVAALAIAAPVTAQTPPDPALRLAQQVAALRPLAWMDGVWRGPASTIGPGGQAHAVAQTERIGPMLGGAIKVLEGRGYNPDGTTGFNAFATLSFEPATGAYTLHSHAMGQVGDFPLKPTADGYVWEIPAGPMTIRYTAVVKDGVWRETGERILPGRPPIPFFEMTLTRLGDSAWPAAGAIPPR
ncbi:MAG: hypothetical protein JWP92_2615 [Caulobacter sp.]|nr:hypothetical protein [Caulobacter sp.]